MPMAIASTSLTVPAEQSARMSALQRSGQRSQSKRKY
jgi:hypothetical protein